MRYTHRVEVMWADCDPAQIVFHPHYFRWMDDAAHKLFSEAGYNGKRLLDEFGIPGAPLVSAHADFRNTAKLGDLLDIECFVSEWGTKSFTVTCILRCGDKLIAEGVQSRVWCEADPDEPSKLKALPVPDHFKQALGG